MPKDLPKILNDSLAYIPKDTTTNKTDQETTNNIKKNNKETITVKTSDTNKNSEEKEISTTNITKEKSLKKSNQEITNAKDFSNKIDIIEKELENEFNKIVPKESDFVEVVKKEKSKEEKKDTPKEEKQEEETTKKQKPKEEKKQTSKPAKQKLKNKIKSLLNSASFWLKVIAAIAVLIIAVAFLKGLSKSQHISTKPAENISLEDEDLAPLDEQENLIIANSDKKEKTQLSFEDVSQNEITVVTKRYTLPKGEYLEELLSYGDIDYINANDVKRLQKFLRNEGYNIKVDGNFRANTKSALIKFQRRYHLRANGIVGKKTRAVINRIIRGKNGY